jgi:hypothetical protein
MTLPKSTSQSSKSAFRLNLLTEQQRLCHLYIISEEGHFAQDKLVDISELEMLQPGVTPFSLMTMPLDVNWQVSLVVERRNASSA